MQAHLFILGFVQGVGFRRFVRGNAKKLGLTGWVKNIPDGRVEVVVEGRKEEIEKLINVIEKGSFFSEVKSVNVNWENLDNSFGSFEITR